ncbi:LysR substrate-binding domain-containing protein [Klebsiella quasipneumoniae]|uniref:LysR substrate-binding domain-containing protein n=5 Tax=Klebsiella pneumoniae complex TaxID=3390273 RepID=UPI002203FC37|nr:LysR substrate-binding domain-containing protein [Klebsiella quasipneumoniae]BDO04737.1 LysR family transcriptional regulator [Klebsiella quasipneumoniae subsp. quasipneumoniae]
MGEYVVPQLINKYSLSPEFHNVTFSFTQGTSLTLLQELKAGKVDLAICSYIADEPDIDFIPVIQQELVVVNLKQLYYFKRLSETVDLVEAASSLCITQPSLSHAISELEKELGVALFARQGRNVKITQNGMAGLVSIDYGIAIMPRISALSHYNVHILKIKNTLPPRYIYLANVVPQLINKYSLSPEFHNVTFSFTQGTSLTLLQELKAGKVDLAICSYIADEPDIDFIPVIQQELVVVTARDHPLARLYEHEVDLVETIHYPYIYFSENSGLRPFIDNVFMQQKLVPEIACYVEEDTAMAGLVSIDYGIAIMPRISALSHYNVHILKIKNTLPPRYIYLATMKDRGLSPALQSFKNVVIHDSQKIC